MSASGSIPAEGSRGEARLPTVLIVDDSRDAADSLASLFGAHGYKALVAYHWAAALETAKSNLPDVILLDLGMPEMDGHQVARSVAAKVRHPPGRVGIVGGPRWQGRCGALV